MDGLKNFFLLRRLDANALQGFSGAAVWADKQQELARKDQTIEAQKAQIEKQRIQIENMIQALLHARKKLFGPSTEVSKNVDGQLSLFDTAQELAEELAKEQKEIAVGEHTRKARQPGVRAEMLSGLVQCRKLKNILFLKRTPAVNVAASWKS